MDDVFEEWTGHAAIKRHITRRRQAGIAFWLCVFFGWLGVHRYYLHMWPSAVLYTLALGGIFFGWAHDICAISQVRQELS